MSAARYPRRQGDLIPWARARATTWVGGQGGTPNIGLTQQQADAFQAAVTTVEDKLAAQISAIEAAERATEEKDEAYNDLLLLLGSYVRIIDGFGRSTKDPAVWTRAGIDAPKKASERPAPPIPTSLPTVTQADGSVLYRWEVTSGSGTQYEVQRAITALDGNEGPWTVVAITGDKAYVDLSVPVGVRRVSYRVRGRLSNNQASDWSVPSPANFGTQGAQGGPLSRVA